VAIIIACKTYTVKKISRVTYRVSYSFYCLRSLKKILLTSDLKFKNENN